MLFGTLRKSGSQHIADAISGFAATVEKLKLGITLNTQSFQHNTDVINSLRSANVQLQADIDRADRVVDRLEELLK